MKNGPGEDVIQKMRALKLLLLDVDGVLTDGSIIYDDDGRETKSFDVKDGHGIKLLMRSGVEVGIITSRRSGVVEHRARDLEIETLYQGAIDKAAAFDEIIGKRSFSSNETAYMGDDIVDIPVFRRAGLSVAVADAAAEVKETADYVTRRPGGRGAVREVTELIMRAQGTWDDLLRRYTG